MEANEIGEALKFMVLGMGVVFSFLIILIYVLKSQAFLLSKYFPLQENSVKKIPVVAKTSNTKKIAAIVAVVQHHKNLKG